MSWIDDGGYDGFFPPDYDFYEDDPLSFRKEIWKTKDGREMPISLMDNKHLFNAWKKFGYEFLFQEMVYRIFEEKVNGK